MQSLLTLVVATCFVVMAAGRVPRSVTEKSPQDRFVDYIKPDGSLLSQNIVIVKQEVALSIPNGMQVVLDYELNQMTIKQKPDDTVCFVAPMPSNIPTKQKIEEISREGETTTVQMPDNVFRIRLEKVEGNVEVQLSSVASVMCDGNTLVPTVVQTQAKGKTTKAPKDNGAEVGWGEVLLIIIVIIILF